MSERVGTLWAWAALALVLMSAALLVSACSNRAGHDSRPNLILIVVDTLRADYLGATGRATAKTPHIDGLIREGTYFTNAFTTMPRTTPAVASLFTGLATKKHGSREVGRPLLHGTTLAEVLRAEGYATIAVSANQVAGPNQNLDRGFEQFVSGTDIKDRYADRLYRFGMPVPSTGTGWAEATTAEALAALRNVPSERPVFLWVLYFDPHTVYRPPSPWQNAVDAPRCWELYDRYLVKNPHLTWQAIADFEGVASWGVGDCQKLYDAEIAYVDHEIGKLRAGLRAAGRLEDVVFVFTADHGENFGEGGVFFEHGENGHDAALRVPLAIAGSGIPEKRTFSGAVSLIDVMPTLMGLLDIRPTKPSTMDGVDLSALVIDSAAPTDGQEDRIIFAESASPMRNQSFRTLLTGLPEQRACINGSRFTLCDVSHGKPMVPKLYDQLADPGLTSDIASSHPDVVQTLLEARRRWPPESARQRIASTARFKLVQFPRIEGGYRNMLFDRSADPNEARDVTHEHPRVAARLVTEIDAWARDVPKESAPALDPAVEEAMRNLGYLP